jgi:hypothetical protein
VLELEDLVDGPVDLDVGAVLELVGGNQMAISVSVALAAGRETVTSPRRPERSYRRLRDRSRGMIIAWRGDQDQSGGNVERPGFRNVLGRVRDGQTDGIVVTRL